MIYIEVDIVINACVIDFYTIHLIGVLGEKLEAI